MPLVVDISHLIGPGEPADPGLGHEHLQAGEAFEHPSQEIVVGADAGFVRLVVANVAPEVRARGLPREEYFGVDAVDILLLEPLLGRPGAGRGLIVLLVGLLDVAPLAIVYIEWDLTQGLSLDGLGIAAVG